jgi:hypothetical protein
LRKEKFLQLKYQVDAARINALCPLADVDEICTYLAAFEQICLGNPLQDPLPNCRWPGVSVG